MTISVTKSSPCTLTQKKVQNTHLLSDYGVKPQYGKGRPLAGEWRWSQLIWTRDASLAAILASLTPDEGGAACPEHILWQKQFILNILASY